MRLGTVALFPDGFILRGASVQAFKSFERVYFYSYNLYYLFLVSVEGYILTYAMDGRTPLGMLIHMHNVKLLSLSTVSLENFMEYINHGQKVCKHGFYEQHA